MVESDELAKPVGFTVFRRNASGLTRQFSALDVVIYNVAWSMLLIPGAAYLYLQGLFAFPNGDFVLGLSVVLLLSIPMFVSYSMLASSMPRSGGDYVWQSRILYGTFGFVTMMIMAFTLFIWIALNGWWVTAFSSSPMFTALGLQLNNPQLTSFGTWLSTPTGIFAGTVVVNLATFFLFLPGITPGLKGGRYGFIFVVIAMATITITLAFATPSSFITQFNGFMGKLDPSHPNYYNYVLQTAHSAGFSSGRSISLSDSLGMGTLAWLVLAWPMWVFLNLGEVKGAESLKRMTALTVGSLTLAAVFMMIWGAELVNIAGKDFLGAAGYDFYTPAFTFPVTPFYTNLVSMFGVIPAVLVGLGTIATGFWECWVNYVGGSRIMLAASLDRTWPEWFGRIGRRYRQLVNVGITYLVGGIIVGYFYNFTSFFTYTLYTSMVASIFQWFTMVAAIVFPYRVHMKDVWRTSPASKWVVGGIPIIVLGAIAGLFLQSALIFYELTVTNLFINSVPALEAVGALIVGLTAYYFVTKIYWRSKGVKIELAFRQVPPL